MTNQLESSLSEEYKYELEVIFQLFRVLVVLGKGTYLCHTMIYQDDKRP